MAVYQLLTSGVLKMTYAFGRGPTYRVLLAGIAALSFLAAPLASAQEKNWGPKTVTITVGFPPGGGVDILARLIATELQKNGMSAVVENRAGAGSTLAAAHIARRPGDGSSLFMMNDSFALTPAVMSNLPYDPRKDLAPVIGVAYAPMVVLVPAQSPHKSLPDLMATKSTLNWGSCGAGTVPHLAGEMINIAFKTKNNHIPYKGCGPVLVDLLGSQIEYGVVTVSGALVHLRSGKLRALAITSAKRAPFLLDLPTVAESGAADFQMSQWQGLAVPSSTPEATKQKIYEVVAEIVKSPEVNKRLLDLGYAPAAETPAQFQKVVLADIDRMSAMAKLLNLKVD
jgi:tripartite-type tricarboxylate transporter receptor subunit TctC